MSDRRLDMAESGPDTATANARAVTRRAYQILIRHALEAGDRDKAERWRETMEKLERKWREGD